ncbi:Rho GDP-dissociation inhibitor 1 [Vitis vinifera]|uniref:Rho GDP-dissociation inhibitor 1 n=1 Tax=Vitis vinifera TaxID=29760 RepID=A0A438DTN0_VITVI|nr:Rho GDP-dissociation inhibitor 1 [Vitis vinifera]
MAVGAVGSSNNMGFDEKMEAGDKSGALETKTSETMSANQVGVDESSQNAAEEEEEEVERKIKLGPQFTLKEQLEKDKDDESLRRWKEQLLGTVDLENVGETLEPEVKILSLSIISPGRPNIVLPIQKMENPRVDSSKEMFGTFSPQAEPYTHEMLEETTPSGFFARGSYSARSKFLDDDNKCYLEINYTFDIRKEWATP